MTSTPVYSTPNQGGLLTACTHPLAQHYLALLRCQSTGPEAFRKALYELSRLVLLEATQTLALSTKTIQTPLQSTEAHVLDPERPIVLVPILRAGLSMAQAALDLLPSAITYHLGLYRNEETLKPVAYYDKLPEDLSASKAQVWLLDPMLATGGSAIAAAERLLAHGLPVEALRFACLVAAPEGVAAFHQVFPSVPVVAASLDEGLNERGYIVPGLGDAGDRTFATV